MCPFCSHHFLWLPQSTPGHSPTLQAALGAQYLHRHPGKGGHIERISLVFQTSESSSHPDHGTYPFSILARGPRKALSACITLEKKGAVKRGLRFLAQADTGPFTELPSPRPL